MNYNKAMIVKKRDDTLFAVIGLLAGILLFVSLLAL